MKFHEVGIVEESSSTRLWLRDAYEEDEKFEIEYNYRRGSLHPMPGDIVLMDWQDGRMVPYQIVNHVPEYEG